MVFVGYVRVCRWTVCFIHQLCTLITMVSFPAHCAMTVIRWMC
jgi:hypothetical protein